MHHLTRPLLTLIIILACCHLVRGEDGVLVVHVSDLMGKYITGVVLTSTGDSSISAASDTAGKVRIRLAADTRPGDEVELVLIRVPQDLVFISPWNGRVTVPCFENKTGCVVNVVLGVSGSRELLASAQARLAMVSKVNAANALKTGVEPLAEKQRRANLAEVAKAFGFSPEEVDRAIRALGGEATDPYQLGQVALYERNYPEAEKQLLRSKTDRKEHLEKAGSALADVIISLAQTYYEQGKYREAVTEFKEAVMLRPEDSFLLHGLGNAYLDAGQYDEAGQCYRRALKIHEKALGPEHPGVATGLNNLASLYNMQGKHVAAERLHKRSLEIRLKHYGPQALEVAHSLNNLATVYADQGRYAKAESVIKRALVIYKIQSGPEHPDVAFSLKNLATIYADQGKYAEAESSTRQALVIYEKHLGPEHFKVVTTLEYLAGLYRDQEKYADAEPLYNKALVIAEKSLGLENTSMVSLLENYALLLRKTNRTGEAEKIEARVRAIRAKKK